MSGDPARRLDDAASADPALVALLERSRARADAAGRHRFVALRRRHDEAAAVDPLTLFDAGEAEAPEADRVYWEQPARDRWAVGWGTAAAFEAEGEGRFAQLSTELAAWFAELDREDGGDPASGPLAFGGLAFSPETPTDPLWRGFPAARLHVPERSFVHHAGRTWEHRVLRVEPGEALDALLRRAAGAGRRGGSARPMTPEPLACGPGFAVRADRPHARYRAQVADARAAIARGELEKVVLARSLSLATDAAFALPSFLRGLRELHPSCTCFAFVRGDSVFVGATPERLVSLSGASVETAAVAGTSARGRNPDEDRRNGRLLRESKKEQAEHAVVVRAIRDALDEVCPLEGPEAPELLRLEGLQHLHTPLRGRLRPEAADVRLLDLAGRLHPSPAVGGAPRAEALAWIRAHEDLDRGWYAGPVGFVDGAGGGELHVALRCALVCGAAARLYAGAGIVAGSDPESELRETRLKLRALLAPLTEI